MVKWELPPKSGHMDLPDGVYFQNMTAKDIAKRLKKDDIIIIPTGSTENHGPHSPYGEDTFITTRLAELAAQRTGCTVAQPVWYGSHPQHHIGMPGTIIVPEDVFSGYVRAIIAGFWNAGFRKQILLNLHGQEYVIPSAIQKFGKKYQVPAILVNVNVLHVIPDYPKTKDHGGVLDTPWTHADEGETSLALNLFPEMIKMEDAVDSPADSNLPEGHVDAPGLGYNRPIPWYSQMGKVGMEVICHPEGVVGYATQAEASKFTSGLEKVLDYLVKLHNDILEAYPPGELPDKMTQRPADEIDAVLKGPLKPDGRHLYTIAWPP